MSDIQPDVAIGRRAARSSRGGRAIRSSHLLVTLTPALVMFVLGGGLAAYLLVDTPHPMSKRVVVAAVAAIAVLILVAAAGLAQFTSRRIAQRLNALRSVVVRGQRDLLTLADRVGQGERFAPREPAPAPREGDDPLVQLAAELNRAHVAAGNAVISLATDAPVGGGEAQQMLEVFVNIARRMQSMVGREISELDRLEAQVEDPDLLKGLFHVDHLATRMRRQSESLAVLGGASPRRQWSVPVTLYEVIRAAVAEVEHYSRAKVVPPVDGALVGSCVADIVHLLAEVVENATKFSPSDVTIRTGPVAAGVAIEIDDRGLGMQQAELRQMNTVLYDPSQINIAELLRDGRIGLFVVSALARRHGVRVQLQSNIYGGTQAVIVLPHSLLDKSASEAGELRDLRASVPEPAPPAQVAADPQPVQPVHPQPAAEREHVLAVAEERPPAPPTTPQMNQPQGERPALPTRPVQQSLAPELRQGPPPTRPADQDAGHSPGLMAAFQTGFERSEQGRESTPTDDSPELT